LKKEQFRIKKRLLLFHNIEAEILKEKNEGFSSSITNVLHID